MQRRAESLHASMSPLRRRSSNNTLTASNHRRQSTISTNTLEAGNVSSTADQIVAEEIAALKRYEDFTTIDWIQDSSREQKRRSARRHARNNTYTSWRLKLLSAYDAAQGWLVFALIGVAIGLNAAFLNMITEWLAGSKRGYCTTAFYLNEPFCCWGAEEGCAEWHRWSTFTLVDYAIYTLAGATFAYASARLVKSFAPYAAGSGISEIKCIIAGFVMKGFLGGWTLLIKSIALPLAIASGLSVGKEGPSVHYAVCTGNVISRVFTKYRRSAENTREILSACAAAGVAVAFGSPIGGVLFSLEEMSSYFPLRTLWKSYFTALVATAVLAAMNPFRTGQLVMFTVSYDRSWHFFEIPFYIIIGIFGGCYGAFVMKWNLRAQAFRKRYLSAYPILESTLLAVGTAIICYPNQFLRRDMTESMEILFLECEGEAAATALCQPEHRWRMVSSLFFATIIRVFLVIISYGCKVPAGIFVPSMAIGASFGRLIGILVRALHESFPNATYFAACTAGETCITPGTYAFLGAASALSGIMHLTISVVVIMFELTGALTYILPTMIVVGVTKAVSERFGKGGIADRMIWFNGFPFLDGKEEHTFGVPVSTTMTTTPTVLPAEGLRIKDVERILSDATVQGFPIVDDESSGILLGYIGRTELRYALDRAGREQRVGRNARCLFSPPEDRRTGAGDLSATTPSAAFLAVNYFGEGKHQQASVDFSKFIDPVPLTVHPRLPLETVMELFKKLGPRVILVEHRGRLTGLVTVKDCLKYQFRAEGKEDPREGGQEKVWDVLKRVGAWVGARTGLGGGLLGMSGPVRLQGEYSAVDHDDRAEELDIHGAGPAAGGVELVDRREGVS